MNPRVTKLKSALAAFIIVILVAAPQAQQVAQPPQFAPAGGAAAAAPREPASSAPTDIDLLVGRSTVVNVGATIARVSLTVPDIADAMVTAPSQLLIHGKQPGTISLFVWDRGGAITTYEVKVRRDLSALVEQVKQLFPGEPISVIGSGKDVVISGTVSSQYVVEKAASVAAGYVDKAENVVNLLKQQEGVASNQVMLRVRFAEVSRSAVQELGASFFANGFKKDWSGRVAPPAVPSPDFDAEKGLVFSDFLNLFVFNSKEGLGGVVKALQTKGLFQSLAEPNLIATNGKEASFLAGGEYPYPVVQSGNGNNSVTIMFKEFGVRLSFTPTVLGGDLVHLKVRPEVSSLDFANAVNIDGFRIPALSTRRTETEVELRDGQTFAIAGLLNNTLTNSLSKIPGIGDIPILGNLFRSKAHQKNQTELVVMITPVIMKRGQMGASEGLPSLVAPYLEGPSKTYPNPEPYVGSPRFPTNQPAPKSGAAANQPVQSAPAPKSTTNSAPVRADAKPVTRPIQSAVTLPQAAPATQAKTTPAVAPAPAPAAAQPAAVAAPPAPLVKPTPAPVAAPKSSSAAPSKPAGPTKEQLKALDRQHAQQKKAAEEAARQKAVDDKRQAEQDKIAQLKAAEQDRIAQQKAEEDRRAADRLAKDRAAREAEVAKKSAEAARHKTEEDQKRDKDLADAAARLQQAQQAYQAEVDKAKTAAPADTTEKKSAGTTAPRR
jgi:pilus assembly protein CpaC